MSVSAGDIAGNAASYLSAVLKPHLSQNLTLLPHQIPPSGDWYGWLLMGGRGSGKTAASAHYLNQHALSTPCMKGPVPHWMSIIAPTQGDAATSGFYGPSGVRAINPDTKLVTAQGGTVIRWPNGAEARLFGANAPEDVERLRSGGNRCCCWVEELAAWRYLQDCWDHMTFGLRLGSRPHWIGSTTPKPKPLIREIASGIMHGVVVTTATTDDNPHLPEHIRQKFYERYANTTLGAQELQGRLIDQDENALWRREQIEGSRLLAPDRSLHLITVGVDPSGGSGEQGIVVVARGLAGRDELPHGYCLDDRSCRLPPHGWGLRAVQAAVDWEAGSIAVETNFGGDMATATIRGAADALGVSVPIRRLTASRGKRPRAEPVSALSAQGRMHHVGVFESLEDQLCTWTGDSGEDSPDRLDAYVWGAWQTRLVSLGTTVRRGSYGGGMMTEHKIVQ